MDELQFKRMARRLANGGERWNRRQVLAALTALLVAPVRAPRPTIAARGTCPNGGHRPRGNGTDYHGRGLNCRVLTCPHDQLPNQITRARESDGATCGDRCCPLGAVYFGPADKVCGGGGKGNLPAWPLHQKEKGQALTQTNDRKCGHLLQKPMPPFR